MNANRKVLILAEGAMCVALGSVLSLLTLFRMPMGGSVTPFSTLPVIVFSIRRGAKWGIGGALTFSLVQLLLGISNVAAIPVKNFYTIILCAALDYVLAYAALGLTGPIARRFKKPWAGICVGVAATGLTRLLCSVLSGIIIWGAFAPEGMNIAVYSFAYNASWCLPDVAITLAACLALTRVIPFIMTGKEIK